MVKNQQKSIFSFSKRMFFGAKQYTSALGNVLGVIEHNKKCSIVYLTFYLKKQYYEVKVVHILRLCKTAPWFECEKISSFVPKYLGLPVLTRYFMKKMFVCVRTSASFFLFSYPNFDALVHLQWMQIHIHIFLQKT